MTAEKECECVFFKALPPPDQISNREFRLIAQEGRDVPGLAVSLCGSCVKQAQADYALAQKIESFLSTNRKH